MKNCKVCGLEFTPKHESRGHEQVYCSVQCRGKAYKMRKIHEMENQKQGTAIPDNPTISGATDVQPNNNRIEPKGTNDFGVYLDILEGKYQARTEALEYKLKYEQAVKELEQAKQEIFELRQEIDELDEDEPETDLLGIIGNVTDKAPNLADAVGLYLKNPKIHELITKAFSN